MKPPPAALAAAAVGMAAGLAALNPLATLTLLALLGGILILRTSPELRTGLLVGSTFVTAYRIEFFGASLRLEHLVLVACLLALVMEGRTRALFEVVGDRTMLLFAAFVVWGAVASVFQAPDPGDSLMIAGWLALDWLLLVVLVATAGSASDLARTGALWMGVAAAVAVVLWIAGQVFGTSFGLTQAARELSGARSAAGLSFEPNLLGATAALWAFVAFAGAARLSAAAQRRVIMLAILAVIVSFTRAAGVGLLAGLLVWSLLNGARAVRRAAMFAFAIAGLVLALATVAPTMAEPITIRASQAFDFDSGTGQLRVRYWNRALGDLDGANLLFGLGTNSFGHRHFDPTFPGTRTPAYLGNLPLQVLYESGVVGVLLLTGVVVSLFTTRRLRDGKALGLLTVYLVCASATSPFWYGTTWVIVAIAVLDRRRLEAEAEGDADAAPPPALRPQPIPA